MIDSNCIDAWEYLCERHLLTKKEECELLLGPLVCLNNGGDGGAGVGVDDGNNKEKRGECLQFDKGMEWLRDLYILRLSIPGDDDDNRNDSNDDSDDDSTTQNNINTNNTSNNDTKNGNPNNNNNVHGKHYNNKKAWTIATSTSVVEDRNIMQEDDRMIPQQTPQMSFMMGTTHDNHDDNNDNDHDNNGGIGGIGGGIGGTVMTEGGPMDFDMTSASPIHMEGTPAIASINDRLTTA